MDNQKCVAEVRDGWSTTRCRWNVNRIIEGLGLCGQHANMALRWLNEGRLARMAEFWWGQKTRRAAP